MQADRLLACGSYRWDPQTGQLWRGKQEVSLTGKASAVLRYLVERAGQLVTKEELFAAVWPQTVVSDAALSSCIQELRHALRDDAKKPRYIETVHRRGYRFLPTVTTHPVQGSTFKVPGSQSAIPNPHSAINLVGREAEPAQLHGWLAKALSGERQSVFVTGEPGIGKTSVVEAFLSGIGQRGPGNEEQRRQKAKIKGQKVKGKNTNP